MLRALFAATLILAPLCILTGCQNLPPPYPLPSQFVPFETFRPYRVSRIITVGEQKAADHFVSGILPAVGGWAWTNRHAVVKVRTAGVENVHYVIDFLIADETFKYTGPVKVTFFVNNHQLDTAGYDKPGQQHWEKIVPAEWLQPNSDAQIEFEVDKVWTSPGDGAKLGLILTKIGLTESRPGQ